MPRDAIILSDGDQEVAKITKGKSVKGTTAGTKQEPSEEENTEEGDEEEEEYEIEVIIDSQRSGKGKFRYFVKWKGYDEKHNSWVEEDDAGNAGDLIDQYWRTSKKKAAGRKSGASAASGTSEKESETSTSAVKKRGRSSAKQESDVGDVSDGDRLSAAKKARKSNGTAKNRKKSVSTAPMDVDEDNDIERMADMSKYLNFESWEDLILSVDTVEKDDQGLGLMVYFTMKKGKDRHVQPSHVCRKKFPQLLLEFYEEHLRWKQVETEEDAIA